MHSSSRYFLLLSLVSLCVYSNEAVSKDLPSEHICYQGSWQFDEKSSDSQKRVVNKLKRHIKRQASTQYPRKNLPEKKLDEAKLPSAIPVIAFLSEDIDLMFSHSLLSINSDSLQREVDLHGGSQSHSLKDFHHNNRTVTASFEYGAIFIDNKMVTGLSILEHYQLNEIDRLHHVVELRDGFDKPVVVNRYYQRIGHVTERCDAESQQLVIKAS